MKFDKRRIAVVLCSVAVAAMSTTVDARPVKKRVPRDVAVAVKATLPNISAADQDQRYPVTQPTGTAVQATHVRGRSRAAMRTQARAETPAALGGFGSSSLVAEARKYLGTNPTGRSSLWCGAFLDMVLKRTGHAGGGNLASSYARYGKRVSGPQVGAIAVMGRRGGGHVGVVSGVDASGNPIIVSGNHNRTVAETVYPRGRIYAYVVPD